MSYIKISDNHYDCTQCPTRCDGKSKLNYRFEDDVAFAEEQEQMIIDYINTNTGYQAAKSHKDGYPDIEIYHKDGSLRSYLEIKAQRRTFMMVKERLPQADLVPSETLALNLSDLLRYFKIEKTEQIPVAILWVLTDRPCVLHPDEQHFYYQHCRVLQTIYNKYKHKRRFRRQSGKGDIVNGEHKGVVVNYHFSLNELKRWMI
ncbi:MAG: hypothetical protein CR968_02340 [Flavobacteriia bacterium]|nr:MAG: hypothetical protein CR968_02340 [Flavobacteriia bacterium]